MLKSEFKEYLGHGSMQIIDAMKQIDLNTMGILYIVNDNGSLVGSLTDGDIRRWIISGGDLHARVTEVMNPSAKYTTDEGQCKNCARIYKIRSVPIVDDSMVIKSIYFADENSGVSGNISDALKDTPVIIMAGGKGVRLQPYTSVLPKPLIPIGGVPILERIMRRFNDVGVKEFHLVINYKKELIKAYFSETDLSTMVFYTEEDAPLGTAGGIRLIDKAFDSPVFVTNCDIIISAEYTEIIRYHNEMQNAMTIVSAVKNIEIPYGVMHTESDGNISSIDEKPRFSFLINTGMYVVNPEYFNRIPDGRSFHMTELADALINEGLRVGMFPVGEENFFDMGEFEELRKMEEWLTEGRIS